MSVLSMLILILPVALLVLSVLMSVKMVQRGAAPKKAMAAQVVSLFVILIVCLVASVAAAPADTAAATDNGLRYIGKALAVGLGAIGGGIAVGGGAPAAIGATAEDPKAFGKAIVFVALGEGLGLYGLLIALIM